MTQDAVCIVGMAGRFPGASSVDDLCALLRDGRIGISQLTDDQLEAAGVSAAQRQDLSYVAARGVIDDVDQFDAGFFGFSAAEAEILDPQQRLLLECGWEALENSGCLPQARGGHTGVFVGGMLSTYLFSNVMTRPDVIERSGATSVFHGNVNDSMATRLAYKLNLRGPALTVQTACSTSLVAVHLAAQSLLDHECDLALAGGVSVRVPQHAGYLHHDGGIESADGQCRPFDASASGTVFGNGVGIVVLKRLSDAVADGDGILAVVLGSAMNNDGDDKVSFAAPSVSGQVAVMEEALAVADIEPASVQYLEAHATGTPIGDPIEAESIRRVYGAGRAGPEGLLVGATKANLGHLDSASGVAGLIATVLALRDGVISPHPSFERRNPAIADDGVLIIPSRLQSWPSTDGPRRAAVSAFGVGGTNAHVVLEEAPPRRVGDAGSARIGTLALSARSAAALDSMTDRLTSALHDSGVELADVVRTLQRGRMAFAHRRVVTGSALDDAVGRLARRGPGVRSAHADDRVDIGFLFSGQGSGLDLGAVASLYSHDDVYRQIIDRSARPIRSEVGIDLPSIVGGGGNIEVETAAMQPFLFTTAYATAAALQERGLRPTRLIGHSIGEYAAACVAGVWTFDDTLQLVMARGRLMGQMAAGAMLAVGLDEEALRELLPGELDIAAINGPRQCVVAGEAAAIGRFSSQLSGLSVPSVRLATDKAFHSRATDAVAAEFRRVLEGVTFRAPSLPIASNVTGTWLTDAEATDPGYWVAHLRRPVRFHAGIVTLMMESSTALLCEVGPGRALARLVEMQRIGAPLQFVTSTQSDQAFEETVAAAWTLGVDVRLQSADMDSLGRTVALPTYPFERTRHWIEPARTAVADDRPPSLSSRSGGGSAQVQPVCWQQSDVELADNVLRGERLNWLVFDDGARRAGTIIETLSKRGQVVTVVTPGPSFAKVGRGRYEMDLSSPQDYIELMTTLRGLVRTPTRIVQCWSTDRRHDHAMRYEAGFLQTTLLVKAVVSTGMLHRLSIGVVTTEAFDVIGNEDVRPAHAMAVGLVLTVPDELDNISMTLIDTPAGAIDETAALRVAAETHQPRDRLVAFRGRHRWTRGLGDVVTPNASPQHAQTYVITGGLGDIGVALAIRLVQGGHRVALISRRSQRPDVLEPLGDGLLCLQADVDRKSVV